MLREAWLDRVSGPLDLVVPPPCAARCLPLTTSFCASMDEVFVGYYTPLLFRLLWRILRWWVKSRELGWLPYGEWLCPP